MRRNYKKIIGMLLAAVMVIGMLPMTAMAVSVETITSLSATVTAPVAGKEPSFEAETDSKDYIAWVECWYEGGTVDNLWEDIDEYDDYTFKSGMTYVVDVCFACVNDKKEISYDAAAKINGKTAAQFGEIYSVAFTTEGESDEDEFADAYKVIIPVEKKVEKLGKTAPGKTTFNFEIAEVDFDNDGGIIEPVYVKLVDSTVTIKGEGTFEDELVLAVDKNYIDSRQCLILVREVDDGKDNWVYDETIYAVGIQGRVMPCILDEELYDEEHLEVYYFCEGEDGDMEETDVFKFTNSYDYTKPKEESKPVKTYNITLKDDFETNYEKASKGTVVPLYTDEDISADDILVTTDKGKEIEVKDRGDGKFTFVMPSEDVTVEIREAEVIEEEIPEEAVEEDEEENIVLTIDSTAVWVFDEYVLNDVAPVIRNDRTMLPIRFVAEALGADVAWDDALDKVIISKDELEIEVYIDSPVAFVNGETVELDAPAFIESSRTYLPLRFVAENLGAEVEWDGTEKTVTIIPGK